MVNLSDLPVPSNLPVLSDLPLLSILPVPSDLPVQSNLPTSATSPPASEYLLPTKNTGVGLYLLTIGKLGSDGVKQTFSPQCWSASSPTCWWSPSWCWGHRRSAPPISSLLPWQHQTSSSPWSFTPCSSPLALAPTPPHFSLTQVWCFSRLGLSDHFRLQLVRLWSCFLWMPQHDHPWQHQYCQVCYL